MNRKWLLLALLVALVALAAGCGGDDEEEAGQETVAETGAEAGGVVTFETGRDFKSILLPKFTGIAVFDQANEGAREAAGELQADPAEFLGPTADNSVS